MRNPLFYPTSFHLSECLSIRLSLIYQVVCGPNNKGYTIHLPTTLLKTIAPALKWGLLLLKVALATQGIINIILSSPLSNSIFSRILHFIVNRLNTKHREAFYLIKFNVLCYTLLYFTILYYTLLHFLLYYTVRY